LFDFDPSHSLKEKEEKEKTNETPHDLMKKKTMTGDVGLLQL
jgi:hypothetical protein